MLRVLGCIATEHDLRLVLLAGLLCLFATFVAAELLARARNADRLRHVWLAASGIVLGCAIWTTHFIAILSYHVEIPISYDARLTVFSIFASVSISTLAIAIAVWSGRTLVSGLVLALAIGAMHFIGMAALRGPIEIIWDYSYVIGAATAGAVMGPLAMTLAWRSKTALQSFYAGGACALAICVMHFTAMTAVTLVPTGTALVTDHAFQAGSLALIVALITALIVSVAFVGILADRTLGRQKLRGAEKLAAQFEELQQSQRALESAQRTLSAYQAGLDASAIVAITDARGIITHANKRFCEVSGYGVDELVGRDHRLLNSGVHSRQFFVDLWRCIGRGDTFRGRICNRAKSGALYWVDTTIVPLIGPDGRPDRYVSIRYDITEHVKSEAISARRRIIAGLIAKMQSEAISSGSIFRGISQALNELRELVQARSIFVRQLGRDQNRDALPGIYAITQQDAPRNSVTTESDGSLAITMKDLEGLSAEHRNAICDRLADDSFFDHATNAEFGADRFIGLPLIAGVDLLGVLAFDDSVDMDESGEAIERVAAAIGELLRVERDVERQAQAMAKAESLAKQDLLTGLGNRRALMEQFDGRTDHPSAKFALILIDLDRFKPINDTYGHLVGDRVLQIVAQRLRKTVRGDSAIVRLGGDEFAVLTSPEGKADVGDDVRRLADRILHVLTRPIAIDDVHVSVGASIGVAMYPKDAENAQELLHLADATMYRAKKKRGEVQFFDASMDESIRQKASLEAALKAAIATEKIEPHYQPIVRLGTGEICGHEVLARWTHEQKGSVSPQLFIPLAEDAGLIDDLFWALLRKACNEHLRAGLTTSLSVNLSAAQTKDPMFPQRLLKAMTAIGFPMQRLEVEVTETAMISDLERARALLQSLRNLGVRIALDDFGTGYSSLVLLRDLPIDKVKIDKSFVGGIDFEANATIIEAILGMALALNLQVTAEGIENPGVARLLRAKGCTFGQGYLFGKAQPHLVNAPYAESQPIAQAG